MNETHARLFAGVFRFHGQGVLISQRCLSLSGLNLASVTELAPIAERASGSVVLGTALGMMRQVPSVSWSMRQSCSGPPVKAGSVTSSPSSVAANVRSVPSIVILK